MCKYYFEEMYVLPMGPFGNNQTVIRKCSKSFVDENGNQTKIKECWHFNDFTKCKYFESKEIK